jgi:Integrase
MTQVLEANSPNLFDPQTREFLSALKRQSTRDIYTAGLKVFQTFYNQYGQGSIADFLDRVSTDLQLPPGKRARVATNALREFINYMQEPKADHVFSGKTINTYVSSVRSLVSHIYDYEYQIPIRGIGLPDPEVKSKKTAWTLELFSKFIEPMKPMYKALAATILMSGQGLAEVLSLTYVDIQLEFEQDTRPIKLEFKRRKTGVKYMTFLGSPAINLLDNYFTVKGKPQPNERLFPVEEETVERYFSRRALKLIEPWEGNCPMRPHTLRAAFDKLLIKGQCPPIYAEFWMGHAVDKLKAAYIISGMSPEEWRQEYLKFEPLLTFKLP